MADDFLSTYTPLANEIGDRTGLNPAVVLGIIDTETGGGKHVLGNNIFGITPPGGVARYPDVQTASEAFVTLMQTPRYRGVAAATDPASQAAALVKGGYNTVNPQYASIVANKALNIGKQLGYQDNSGGGQGGPAVYSTSSQPVATSDQPTAPSYSDSPTPVAAPQQPTQPPATTGSAKDRVLSDPALGGTGKSTAPASGGSAKDRVLADPALKTTEATTTTQAASTDEMFPSGTPQGADVPPWMMQGPPGQSTDERVRNLLAPAPNTTYGDVLPLAVDETTREMRFAMPNMLRAPLIGLTSEGPTTAGTPGATFNPQTGTFGITPEAASVAPFAALPLRFSGANPLQFVPPGALEKAPLPPDAAANLLSPDARIRATEPPAGPTTSTGVPVTPPTPVEPPAPAVPLSAEDQRWVAGTQARLEEINQANRAAGVPGSLGAAATPEELAQLTPAQMKAYRRQAELGEILAPPPRELDRSIYVEGSEPTRAEYSADPAISQQESLHRERDPNSFDPRLNQNTQARVNSYENMMGTDPQIVDLKEAKSAAAERDGSAYIQAARPLELQPALEWLDGKLADPRIQERPEVRDVLTKLRDSLFDESGQLKTDPRAGWGMHDNMINRLDRAGDRTSAERYAITQMKEYKDIIDGVNNTASDGAFQTFLDNQSHYAQQINSMEELQKFRPRFTNTKGEINANAFHKFVTDLAIRRGRPGVDPAMDISDNTMRGLINIDKDLKRATNIDLGKARGSNTNLLFTLAQAAGLGAAHLGVAAMTHGAPTANLFLQGALNQAGRMTGNVMLRRAVRRGLAPPPGGYDYNPLQP